ncbi:MAG: Crp/Fnr family transcriptional regulator [Burkholderiales bacterium]|nr:Crp/Fnr family transcriptional regulator [Burkholderiales bacterium]
MPPSETPTRLAALYPLLASLPAAERDAVLEHEARLIAAPASARLFDEGSPCPGFPMLLSGAVRVARGSPGGRSLELYRVTPGEICIVSASCLFGQGTIAAHGETVEPSEIVLLSPAGFERWAENPGFRRQVFGTLADRIADLMVLVEAVAFQRVDERLARKLLAQGPVVHSTHQGLADELGTVREIVTRLLRRFERAGWVLLARERIEVVDGAALHALAGGHPM